TLQAHPPVMIQRQVPDDQMQQYEKLYVTILKCCLLSQSLMSILQLVEKKQANLLLEMLLYFWLPVRLVLLKLLKGLSLAARYGCQQKDSSLPVHASPCIPLHLV